MFWSCSVDSDKKKVQQEVITTIEAQVILPTYKMLYERVLDLQFSVEKLDVADSDALLHARDSWLAAREIWEQSEGYIVNYAAVSHLKYQLDKYTLAKDLNEHKTIAQGAYQQLEELLWGQAGKKQAEDLTNEELLAMNNAALVIAVSTQKLLQHIHTELGASPLQQSSEVSKHTYCRQRMQRYIVNMLDLTADIMHAKIDVPFNTSATTLADMELESQYSDNAKFDIMNNMLGLERLYLGNLDKDINDGLSAYVRSENEVLDMQLTEAIAESKRAIAGLPESYAMALTHDRDALSFAKYKIKVVHDLIQDELLPIVQTL